ncbi:hypothetical protein [Cellulomonas sp. URHB0016]
MPGISGKVDWQDLAQPELDRIVGRTAGATLAHRASRVRNSLVHGNPADERVIATVRDISRYRAYQALDIALQAVADGVEMVDELDRRRMLAVIRNAELSRGVSLADGWATT